MILWSGPIRLASVLTEPTTCGLDSHETSPSAPISTAASKNRKLLFQIVFKVQCPSVTIYKMINLELDEHKQGYCKEPALPNLWNGYFLDCASAPWRGTGRSVSGSFRSEGG